MRRFFAHSPPDNIVSPTSADVVSGIKKQQVARHSTWVSIAVNLSLAILQITFGVMSYSQGLIADGVHSLADLFADGVVLVANSHSHRQADEDHPYGHYRFENAASLILGLILMLTGFSMLSGAIARIESFSVIRTVSWIGLGMACTGLLAKELLFRYLLAAATKVRSSLLIANAWHARSDSLSSLIVTLGIFGNISGYRILDPVAALIVGLIVLRMGGHFAWDALNDLVDRAASREEYQAIHHTIMSTPGVLGLHNLRARKVGDMLMVDVHLEINGELRVREGHAIAELVQERILESHAVVDVMTHVDPVPDDWNTASDPAKSGQ